jgi:hypothetical protein
MRGYWSGIQILWYMCIHYSAFWRGDRGERKERERRQRTSQRGERVQYTHRFRVQAGQILQSVGNSARGLSYRITAVSKK